MAGGFSLPHGLPFIKPYPTFMLMSVAPMSIIRVLVPLALPKAYDYRVPPDMSLAAGDFVRVPLGTRRVTGVVWGAAVGNLAPTKLKDVIEKYEVPPLSEEMRDFIDWVANYVMAPPGLVLRQTMRVPAALEAAKPLMTYRATGDEPARITPARTRVLQAARASSGLTAVDLARHAEVSAGVVRGLIKAGALGLHELPGHKPFPPPDMETAKATGPQLSTEQADAATALGQAVRATQFGVHVLDGVTGSGKTEVYFEAIIAGLESGKNILILLPEISLTAQILHRFEARFGYAPALWHSGLGASERRRTWREVAENRVRVLVGARSALFLPWHDLGLIVVDEEHDGGYKQEDGVVYNARDMAVVRARLAACPIILASATPSLETFVNMREQRYMEHRLTARHGGAELPDIQLVDMRLSPPPRGKWLVPEIIEAVGVAIGRGEQSMLFLNRRGYAPLTLCRACGHRYACSNCDTWMVEHRFDKRLQCHHCGQNVPVPNVCTSCGEADQLVACGPGVERITEEIADYYPDARIAVLSSDHVGDHVGGAVGMRELIARLADGGADIIVGTQIVAKGHHFPKLSTAGVVDADLGLGNGDLRAAERTFQMLSQVAGRSGREGTMGMAMLQTHMPEHPVLQALPAGDRDAFMEREAVVRQQAGMPPYGRLAAIVVSAMGRDEAHDFVQMMARQIPAHDDIRVLGPAPAPMARLRNRYRFRFLIKGGKTAPMQAFIRHWLDKVKLHGSLRLSVDIDPYSFM